MRFKHLILLSIALVLAGCTTAPSLARIEAACRDLSHADLAKRDEALAFLHDIYTWKHQSEEVRRSERLSSCLPAAARLLLDPDPKRASAASAALGTLIAFNGPRRAAETVPWLLRDAERLWARVDSATLTAEALPWRLGTDLDHLAKYGPQARSALPLVTAILADRALAKRANEGERDGWEGFRHDEDLFAWGLIRSARAAKDAILGSDGPTRVDTPRK